jgi:hypothetical protein
MTGKQNDRQKGSLGMPRPSTSDTDRRVNHRTRLGYSHDSRNLAI